MVGRAIRFVRRNQDADAGGHLVGGEGIATVHKEVGEFLVDFVIEICR